MFPLHLTTLGLSERFSIVWLDKSCLKGFQRSNSVHLHRDLLAGVSDLLPPLGHTDLSNEFLMQILLYGDKDFPNSLNKDLRLSTLRFIHETGRFD